MTLRKQELDLQTDFVQGLDRRGFLVELSNSNLGFCHAARCSAWGNTLDYEDKLFHLWFTFHNTFCTLFLNFITHLSVRVLTCLQTPFVPPWKLNDAVPEAVAVTPEHYPPPLSLNRSHRTDQKILYLLYYWCHWKIQV